MTVRASRVRDGKLTRGATTAWSPSDRLKASRPRVMDWEHPQAPAARHRLTRGDDSQVCSVRPVPVRNVTDRMKLGIRSGAGVLLGDACSELDVLPDRAAERLVVGQIGFVESLQVDLDEPLTLLVGDLQVAMHVDDVPKTELIGKSWRAAERLSGEPGQVFDVGGNAVREQLLEHGVGERLGVEDLLEPVQAFVAAGMLIQRLVTVSVCRVPPTSR